MFNYKFPHIRHINDVLPALEGFPEFAVVDQGSYTSINYRELCSHSFGAVEKREVQGITTYHLDKDAAIRRECRGIIFSSTTGEILRRPFHKFHNLGEKEETLTENVKMDYSTLILDKLDGSMLSPFIVEGEVIFGTKAGLTEVAMPVMEFVEQNTKYKDFSQHFIERGWTPIFEWCSRKQKIVLDYKEDQLILTGMRRMIEGDYMTYDKMQYMASMFYIPVVTSYPFTHDGVEDFIKHTRDLVDTEGFVVRWDTGHMVKCKSDWYVAIHKAKEKILRDRNIVALILDDELDDVKAHLDKEDREKIEVFELSVIESLNHQSEILMGFVNNNRHMTKKDFAIGLASVMNPFSKQAAFRVWDNPDQDVFEIVSDVIRKNLTKDANWNSICATWFNGVKCNV